MLGGADCRDGRKRRRRGEGNGREERGEKRRGVKKRENGGEEKTER